MSPKLRVKTDDCVPLLKALGDETRWTIVRLLITQPMNVTELCETLRVAQPNVSKHLKILREAGLVTAEKTGKEVENRITDSFKIQLTQNQNRLDVGCCSFDFQSRKIDPQF